MQRGRVQISPFGVIVTLRFVSSDRTRYRWSCRLGTGHKTRCRVTMLLKEGRTCWAWSSGLIITWHRPRHFWGEKAAEVGSGLGKAIREFKRGTSEAG